MTSQKKKITVLVGAAAIAAGLCIFGGQYIADRIQADRAAALQAQMQSNAITQQEQEPVLPAEAPIETETVYDENGNIAIEPVTNDTAAADISQPAESAAQPSITDTKAPEVSTAPTKPASSNAATAKTSTPKSSSSTADKPAETKPSGGNDKKDTPSQSGTKTDTPAKDTNKDNPSSGSGSNDGKVYVPGFGWMESEGENTQTIVTSSGDINEIIGH